MTTRVTKKPNNVPRYQKMVQMREKEDETLTAKAASKRSAITAVQPNSTRPSWRCRLVIAAIV